MDSQEKFEVFGVTLTVCKECNTPMIGTGVLCTNCRTFLNE